MAKGKEPRDYHAMILSETKAQLSEQQSFQNKLRTAVFGAVAEADVEEVVKGIVSRAKSGDAKAVEQFFNYIMGGSQSVKITQNNYYETAGKPEAQ
jgi:hypothetical protein